MEHILTSTHTHEAGVPDHAMNMLIMANATLTIERSLVEMNDHLAMHNRERFQNDGVFVLNLMSSPGAGKTRLLERTLDDLAQRAPNGCDRRRLANG